METREEGSKPSHTDWGHRCSRQHVNSQAVGHPNPIVGDFRGMQVKLSYIKGIDCIVWLSGMAGMHERTLKSMGNTMQIKIVTNFLCTQPQKQTELRHEKKVWLGWSLQLDESLSDSSHTHIKGIYLLKGCWADMLGKHCYPGVSIV